MPVTGRHSVILNPDSVKRVTPPTTMTPSTKRDETSNHLPTAGEGRIGRVVDWVSVFTGLFECRVRAKAKDLQGSGLFHVVNGVGGCKRPGCHRPWTVTTL
jgi:hypothetical protein